MDPTGNSIFVDADIPMYAHGHEHPLRAACQACLARLVHTEDEAWTSTEIHQEIMYRYLSLARPGQAVQVSHDFAVVVPIILPVTQQDIERAWRLMACYPGLGCRDYIHVAVMLNNHLRRIVSADSHFDLVDEIVRVPPQEFALE